MPSPPRYEPSVTLMIASMVLLQPWIFALGWGSSVAAQSTLYQWTVDVTSPPPVPGKPFTLTWSGGEVSEPVYITLNNYFPPTPDQNIPYGSTDILSNAPNNGSWVWDVPLDISAGHHSFSIGYNPLMLSATTGIFIIDPSQVSPASQLPSPTTTPLPLYNGCGLPPLPDYTYTGYQPPCTITTSGRVETVFPIVPASDSSLFYGGGGEVTTPTGGSTVVDPTAVESTSFGPGVFAQALQCVTSITPTTTSFVANDITTVISVVDCDPTTHVAQTSTSTNGVCHTSGYATYSVAVGSSRVCCPEHWATTPLFSGVYCFTSVAGMGLDKAAFGDGSAPTTTLSGLAFTSAGVVTARAAFGTLSATAESGTTVSVPGKTGAGRTNGSNRSVVPSLRFWGCIAIMPVVGVMRSLLFR